MKIIIANKQRKYKIKKHINELLEKAVNEVLIQEEIAFSPEISILFINNSNIRKLNRQYREIDKPTDVLSFPLYTPDDLENIKNASDLPEEVALGDIAISLEKVEEQAKEYGHAFERELGFLVVHGMLHLLGYDHVEEKDRIKMRFREESILANIGQTRI